MVSLPAPDPRATVDPRRWITLAIIAAAVVIVSLDNTVLTVAIPTILRDFHTTLPSLEWVITGYALTFATLLIIGGKLGDLFGHRRMFMVGAGLFAVGSLIAAESHSVIELVIGEAVIEGIGASLMLPATLAILSTTFEGPERATAFGIWGAVGGAAGSLGPVVGGVLTTDYSWRWAFGINVIVAPLAILGAAVFMREAAEPSAVGGLDVRGAVLIAVSMFCLVFGLSEGGTYGWLRPIAPFVIGGAQLWPATWLVSIIPVSFAAGMVLLAGFVRVERRARAPLFELGQLRHRGFRYGLITTLIVGTGQFALVFVLPVFLQDGKHLTAERNGLWQLPTGLFFLVGSQLGARLTRSISVTAVVRTGLAGIACGFLYVAAVISVHLTFWVLVPGLFIYGIGAGMATAQLTNVVLSDIEKDKAGVASGANSTARQVGLALGIAVMGTLLATETTSVARSKLLASSLPAATKARLIAAIHTQGVSFRPPPSAQKVFLQAISSGAKVPLLFAAGIVVVAFAMSLRIPRISLVAGSVGRPSTGH